MWGKCLIMRIEIHKLKILWPKKNPLDQKYPNPTKYHACTKIKLSKPQGTNSQHHTLHKILYAPEKTPTRTQETLRSP